MTNTMTIDDMLNFATTAYEDDRRQLDAYFLKKNEMETIQEYLVSKYKKPLYQTNCKLDKWTKADQKLLLKSIKFLTQDFYSDWQEQRKWLVEKYDMTIK